ARVQAAGREELTRVIERHDDHDQTAQQVDRVEARPRRACDLRRPLTGRTIGRRRGDGNRFKRHGHDMSPSQTFARRIQLRCSDPQRARPQRSAALCIGATADTRQEILIGLIDKADRWRIARQYQQLAATGTTLPEGLTRASQFFQQTLSRRLQRSWTARGVSAAMTTAATPPIYTIWARP